MKFKRFNTLGDYMRSDSYQTDEIVTIHWIHSQCFSIYKNANELYSFSYTGDIGNADKEYNSFCLKYKIPLSDDLVCKFLLLKGNNA